MRNVCRKNIITHNIYESQKFITFHYNKKIKSTTSKMIKIIETIQIQNSIHLKKNNNKINVLNKKSDYIKKNSS